MIFVVFVHQATVPPHDAFGQSTVGLPKYRFLYPDPVPQGYSSLSTEP
jgi:hypothetical protein